MDSTRVRLMQIAQIVNLQWILVSPPQQRCEPEKRELGHERCLRMFIADFLVDSYGRLNRFIYGCCLNDCRAFSIIRFLLRSMYLYNVQCTLYTCKPLFSCGHFRKPKIQVETFQRRKSIDRTTGLRAVLHYSFLITSFKYISSFSFYCFAF